MKNYVNRIDLIEKSLEDSIGSNLNPKNNYKMELRDLSDVKDKMKIFSEMSEGSDWRVIHLINRINSIIEWVNDEIANNKKF